MTQPTPMPYYSPTPNSTDLSHLRTLSICHYVWGGLTMLFSCICIIYIVMGIWLARGGPANATWTTSTTTNSGVTFSTPVITQQSPPPPPAFGYMIAAMGGCAVIFGWALGTLTIISGRRLAHQRSRIFSMVMAGINCIYFPLGTLLGIFTIVVLARDSVKQLYLISAANPQSMR
jgi:hypothetical protein